MRSAPLLAAAEVDGPEANAAEANAAEEMDGPAANAVDEQWQDSDWSRKQLTALSGCLLKIHGSYNSPGRFRISHIPVEIRIAVRNFKISNISKSA